jgi:1-deoxy-D-xylulose-5-phosphate reductoisomerase
MKGLAILGSTGSIGTQALEVVRNHFGKFNIRVLTAQNNWNLLVEQAREFQPEMVVISNPDHYEYVRNGLENLPTEVLTGDDAIAEVVQLQGIDIARG